MRQASIPKLSKLGTAGRAKLVAIWMATTGKPPAAFRTSRELLASALAWQLQERKFGGLTAATRRRLRVLARAQERKKRSSQLPAASTWPDRHLYALGKHNDPVVIGNWQMHRIDCD